jgi:O-antigen/teichoic acid export membrane protein
MRMSQALSSLLLMVLVARQLTKQEQGYYYTFSSVVALQVFFELGLTFVLMQFSSHEMARLERMPGGVFKGDSEPLARLASLLRFGVRWYSVASLLLLVCVLPLGLLFFNRYSHASEAHLWVVPWILLVGATACTLLFNSVVAVFEGCGEVAEVASLRLKETLTGTGLGVILLLFGGKLFAVSALVCCDALMQAIWLSHRREAIKSLWAAYNPRVVVHAISEILPFQWRIAVSWLSGYLIFQVFNPILFATSGEVEAGKMGMTIAACSGLNSLGMSWISTKGPRMGTLISLGKRKELDQLFFHSVKIAILLGAGLAFLFWCVVTLLQRQGVELAERFLDPVGLGLMLVATLATCVSFSQASYLRAHKQEPFLMLSVVAGIVNLILACTLARLYGARGVAAGYAFTTVVIGVGWGSVIFAQKRKQWNDQHRESPTDLLQEVHGLASGEPL